MRPKIVWYVGSKFQHFHPAMAMRCLFGPTQYIVDTLYLPQYSTGEYIHINFKKKNASKIFF